MSLYHKTRRKSAYSKRLKRAVPNAVKVALENPEICGEWFEGCEVHHINRDETDDRPENLIVLSHKEHTDVHRIPVDVFYKNKYIGRYNSFREAEIDNSLNNGVISYYCKHKKPVSSTFKDWRFFRWQ